MRPFLCCICIALLFLAPLSTTLGATPPTPAPKASQNPRGVSQEPPQIDGYVMRPRINLPISILLNFLPLPLLGIGSFVQGDMVGGLLIAGSTVVGASLLILFPIILVGSLFLQDKDGLGISVFLYLFGGLLLVFSGVVSIAAPILYQLRFNRYKDRYRRGGKRSLRVRRPYEPKSSMIPNMKLSF